MQGVHRKCWDERARTGSNRTTFLSWRTKAFDASSRPAKAAAVMGGLYRWAYHKFYIDEVYSFITKKIIFNLIGRPAAWIDRHIVDGGMNLLATVTARISAGIKGFQSGKVQDYALYFFAGIAGLTVLFIYLYT